MVMFKSNLNIPFVSQLRGMQKKQDSHIGSPKVQEGQEDFLDNDLVPVARPRLGDLAHHLK